MTAFSRKLRDYSAADALEWCIGIAQALDFLHTCSPPILHRDIKLDNLMLTKGENDMRPGIKLVDFGLAKQLVGVSVSDTQPGSTAKGNGMHLTEQTGKWHGSGGSEVIKCLHLLGSTSLSYLGGQSTHLQVHGATWRQRYTKESHMTEG